MELFHCEVGSSVELPLMSGSRTDANYPQMLNFCKRVVTSWAMGAGVSLKKEYFAFFFN